ncbi:hypothetical protein ACFXG4_23680 [Nocardia sp. NPDC059246]|uniref:hypothetical protein n=1 Tax=unclassified Nocardia TaxID=2637762 RepID=UPI0036B5A266
MAVFDVPASAGKKKENRFAFRLNGKVHTIPKLGFISGDASVFARDNQDTMTLPMVYRELIAIERPEIREDLFKLADDQVVLLADAWVLESGVSAGESEASEDS